MGCVQAKPSMNSSPKGLEKLKLESGYVGKGGFDGPRRSTGQRYPHRESSRRYRDEPRLNNVEFGGNNGNVEGDEKLVGKDGNLSKGLSIGEEELVGGWPKWLTDNIPRDVLAGLVPKSAESYHKLDKVCFFLFGGLITASNFYVLNLCVRLE